MILIFFAIPQEKPDQEETEFFTMLYQEFRVPLWRYALSLSHDEAMADDIVHEAFIRLMGEYDRLKAVSNDDLKAYSIAAVRFAAYRFLAKYRKTTADIAALSIEDPADSDWLDEIWSRDVLEQAIQRLDPVQKDVIYLRFYLDLKARQVGQRLNLTETNVRTIQNRATSKLRKLLSKAVGI